ncbi:MAG: 2-dehydropantoate 2-reductase [Candidatus Eremiobacteraeota bacterium]|nr:2-dehydropantoate 2-reductase [Candidatus Eremiobacteraeota bacterium]
MRIAVLGAGAIGGFVAAMLARKGEDIALVARGAHLRAIMQKGLSVRSEAGEFTVQVPASDDLRTLGVFDVVLIALKAHQLGDALPQLAPAISSGATIVPMLNGVPFWYFADRTVESVDPGGAIRAAIPREQIVGCVIHASGNIPQPGTIEQSGGMQYLLGDPNEAPSARAGAISAVLAAAGMKAPLPASIKYEVWLKLLGNASLNPVSALTRLAVGPMLRNPGTREIISRLMNETASIAFASGISGSFDIENRMIFASRLETVKTSMLQDVEAKRPLELDPIVGAVLEVARAFHAPAPTLETIYELTNALQQSYLRH